MLKFYLVLNITSIKKVVKLIFIITPGRCGSTLLLQLANRKIKKILRHDVNSPSIVLPRDDGSELIDIDHSVRKKYHIVHTHLRNDARYIQTGDLVYYLLRKNLVEWIASDIISYELQKWHWKNNDTPNGILLQKKKVDEKKVWVSINGMYDFYKDYQVVKQEYSHVHLVFYEDWTKTYTVPGFDLEANHNKINDTVSREFFTKTKIDKTQYFDYDYLTQLVKKHNNNSIYFDFDFAQWEAKSI